jgi:hypothetical protein
MYGDTPLSHYKKIDKMHIIKIKVDKKEEE